MNEKSDARTWKEVLEFRFREESASSVDADTHREQGFWRMRGGADSEIIARFSDLTAEGAKGNLDHWARHVEGRLAFIIVLDQFSRSLWRGEPTHKMRQSDGRNYPKTLIFAKPNRSA